MSDLASRLQAAVGETYRIERELGGGGMSRVFLAEEVRLGRKVVIKLLPPEMSAGVSVDRFEREILLSASLQHPHIVPLLTAGSHDDLLYYVMPFIEGESLRAKLAREGELPVGETVRILQDVLDALQYAHSHKVVHRDIKPDNILLSGKHAVVTDFGVAKAVSASTGESSLTSLGVALGTPAYMSPEQAAADPHADHRADIYAVGVLAYEMLSGRPPFTGNNAQQVLSAHMTQAPEPVVMHRETVPQALNEVVMRCLHKKPADRWQRADEMVPHLDALLTPSGGMTPTGTQPVQSVSISSAERAAQNAHPVRVLALFGLASVGALAIVYFLVQLIGLPDWVFYGAIGLLAVGLPIVFLTGRRERQVAIATMTGMSLATPVGLERHFTWRKSLVGGGLAFAGLGVVAAAYMAMRTLGIGPVGTLIASGVLGEREQVVLAEFENRTSDPTLGTTVTELMRVGLTQSTIVNVLEPTEIGGVLQRMELDPDTRLDRDLALEVAERDGIKAVITGEISPVGEGFALSARLISPTGAVLTAQQEAASDAGELIASVGKLSGKLRERIGESLRDIRRDPLDEVTTRSLEALRLYTQALNAENAGDDARAVQLLEDAVSVDTAFAMAYRKLGVILGNNFERRARMIEASTKAYEYRDRLTERERYQAIALYHVRVTGQREAAISAYRTLLDRYPDDVTAINNTGVLYGQLRDYVKAGQYYRRALALDSSTALFYSNVARNQTRQGELDGADSTMQLLAARFPGN
ncbi:MAG: protein kinase, partial [Gemmatimonadales bacterium]